MYNYFMEITTMNKDPDLSKLKQTYYLKLTTYYLHKQTDIPLYLQ